MRRLLYSAIVLFSTLGFVELLARTRVASDENPKIQLDFDASLMWTLSADHVQHPDLVPNSLGLRGPELRQPPGVRLLTFGDSSVFGDTVRLPEVFSSVVARQLPAIEPVIGAIPGYSSFQANIQAAQLLPIIQPALVVIGTLWSDSASGQPDAAYQAALQESYARWRHVVNGLNLVSAHLASARWLRLWVHETFHPAAKVSWVHLGTDTPNKPPPLQQTRVPLPDYAANLRALITQTRAASARPVLLMLPHPLDDAGQPLPEPQASYRETMREIATSEAVPLVDGARWFREHPCGCARFSDDIHPNAVGHAALADAVSATLLADPTLAARVRP